MKERQAFLAIRNAIRLENLAEDVARRVSPELRAIFTELGQQFRRMPPGNIEREIWYRQQRLRIADMFAPLSIEMRNQLTQALGVEVAQQMHYAESYLRIAGEDSANLIAAAAPQEGVSALGRPTNKVEFTRQQLHTIAQDTQVLGDRLGDLFRPSLDDHGKHGKWIEQNIALIDRKVKTGFLTGMTNDQIAATLPGLSREAISRNKAIARTAVMDMSARSQEALWQANSGRIKAWEVDSTMDNRICDQCAPWDGVTKTVRGQLPVMPLHVNCRCRVLPLTATELALREKEGPQRRSVVELINAPSKEAAIAKAKLKPGVTDARAYASQVRVKGKKYWRVAVDIKKPDSPLTMGEFLKQASPATQEQVLGSGKRRRLFMEKIAGSADRPPINADRALKEVTEWQPTVTRRPRLSMEMKLEISKLKSQKELMKKNSEGEQHIVYGYLRAKDSGTAKAGTPYYVGIGDSHTRAYNVRGHKKHRIPVPKDQALIRQFGTFPTRAGAAKREQDLIAHYGRKGLDDKGILLNRALGGEGALGVKPSKAALAKLLPKMKAAAAKIGVPFDVYEKMSTVERAAVKGRYKRGYRGAELLKDQRGRPGDLALKAAAEKYEIPLDVWSSFSSDQRLAVRARYRRGKRGADLTKDMEPGGMNPKFVAAAKKYGVTPELWMKLERKERAHVASRYLRGKRGAALLENLDGRVDLKAAAVAKKYEVTPEIWASLSFNQRAAVRDRYARGKRGAALLEGLL